MMAKPVPVSAEPSELLGSWVAKAATRNGRPADDVLGHRLVCQKASFEIRNKEGDLLFHGTYLLQTDQQPATGRFQTRRRNAGGNHLERDLRSKRHTTQNLR